MRWPAAAAEVHPGGTQLVAWRSERVVVPSEQGDYRELVGVQRFRRNAAVPHDAAHFDEFCDGVLKLRTSNKPHFMIARDIENILEAHRERVQILFDLTERVR